MSKFQVGVRNLHVSFNLQVGCAAGKYVPPHLRMVNDDKRRAELEKLKRNVKGLVNR